MLGFILLLLSTIRSVVNSVFNDIMAIYLVWSQSTTLVRVWAFLFRFFVHYSNSYYQHISTPKRSIVGLIWPIATDCC